MSDASRIIDVIDQRIQKNTRSGSKIEYTWGTVASVSADGKTAGAYIYGETDGAYISDGFRVPETSYVSIGDAVKVAMDYGTGERWIEEISVSSAYKKVAINPNTGEILTGDGTSAPEPFSGGGGARNLLKNGGFGRNIDYWVFSQNGDTTATFDDWDVNDASWTLRDGEQRSWDGVGGPYGSTVAIHSTSSGTYEPFINSERVPVLAGQKYSCRALIGQHRTSGAYMAFWFYDNTGAFISGGGTTTAVKPPTLNGGPLLSGWDTLEIDGWVAPSNAQSMVVAIVMKTPYTSGTDLYLFIDRVMLTQTASAQDYQPYVEGDRGTLSAPTGSIVLWPSSAMYPSGWGLCNGQAVSRTTYAHLFGLIGTTYGAGDGSTTFNLPNLVNRVPYGRNAEAIGTTGGATTHTHAGHSNHVFTQPSAHPATSHSAHTGTAVSAHSGTAVATHADHKHQLPFNQSAASWFWRGTAPFSSSGTHTPTEYNNSAGAPSGSAGYSLSNVEDTNLTHTVTQPAAHTVTDPSAHSDHPSESHTGGAVDAHSAHDSPSHMMPYIILNYIIKF